MIWAFCYVRVLVLGSCAVEGRTYISCSEDLHKQRLVAILYFCSSLICRVIRNEASNLSEFRYMFLSLTQNLAVELTYVCKTQMN